MSFVKEFLIAVFTIFLVSAYYCHVKISKIRRKKCFLKNFPSPTTVPVFGNALDFNSPGAFVEKLHEYTKKYGTMIHLQLGPLGHNLLTSDHEFLEFLLSHNKLLRRSTDVRRLEPWIGTGLLTADGGPKWKIHRKLITPAFHFKILEQFVDIFEANGDVLVQKLSKESGNKSVDIYPYVTKCALDAICETAMGTKIDAQNNEASSYIKSVKDMCRIHVKRCTSMLYCHDWYFRLTKDYAVQQKAVKILHDYTKDVIKAKRKELEKKGREKDFNNTNEMGIKKKKVFLDLILEATIDNQSLSDEEIREEVDTFMFAGHDTTATATCFILYCIANSREIQNKILEEQKQIFGEDENPKVTYTHLQEMKYLKNVIKESLRMFTPVPFFGRSVPEDTEYKGMIIPKGLNILIFLQGLHMNPKFYPNPQKFDPTRFENMNNRHSFAYLPFSAGPRNCIGQKYAFIEVKSFVSKVVRNFDLSPAVPKHELDLSPDLVLKSLNGVKIDLKLR